MAPSSRSDWYFPSFLEGAFIEAGLIPGGQPGGGLFPFLFERAFIEAIQQAVTVEEKLYFPSYLEGLSLRQHVCVIGIGHDLAFPFLFGGAFIEARASPTFL